MRTPGLRLRQVFEHTNHFKVTKPTGETIHIAKKGLSPSTVGRLRRFAQGGEVHNYARGSGGDVPPVTDTGMMPEPSVANSVDEYEMLTPQERASVLEAQRLAQPTRQPATPQLTPVEAARADEQAAAEREHRPAQRVAPAPAPTVIINNTPQPQTPATPMQPVAAPAPTATTQKMEAASKAVEPAPAVAEQASAVPAKEGEPGFVGQPAPDTVQPWDLPASAMGEPRPYVAPPAPPMGSFLSRPGLLTPLAAPAVPASTKDDAAAPTDVPVTPDAPMAPVTSTAFKPLTAQGVTTAFDAAVKENPKATIGDVVAQLAGTGAVVPALVRPEIANIPAFAAMQKPDLLKAFTSNIADGLNAIYSGGEAELAANQLALDEAKQQEVAAAEKTQRDMARREDIKKHIETATKAAEEAEDIKPFFSSGGVGSAIGNIIALAVGGFMSGYTGTPNYVYDAYSRAAARDLDMQKRQRDSKWNKVKSLLGDEKAADLLIQADNDLFASIAVKKTGIQQNMLKIQPQMDKLAADLMSKAIQGYGMLDLHLAQAEDEREKPAPKAVLGRGSGKTPGSTPTLEFRKDKYERERTMDVDGVPVQRNTDKGADSVSADLSNRNFMAESLADIASLFDSHSPEEAINILGQTRGDMLARVATMVELFPTGFGFKRAVTDVAKKQLKEALQDPTSFKAFLLTMTGDRDPATGIKTLLREVTSARRKFIEGKADTTSLRDKEAAQLGLWRLEAKEAKLAGRPAPQKPKLSLPDDQLLSVPHFARQAAAPASSASTAPSSPSALNAATVFTVTNTKTGQSKTVDAATASRFRGQPGFTVVP